MKAELAKLVALQKTDTLIKQLEKSIKTTPARRVAVEQEFEARAFEIREIQKNHDAAAAAKTKFEQAAAEATTNLDGAEQKLKASQNQKQYEAAVREKAAFQKQLNDLETQILEKTEALEAAEKVLTERADEIAAIETERTQRLADFEAETENQKSQLETEKANRAQIFDTLPKNLASVYDRLVQRIRDGVAVAEVKNGACASCSMKLRPQMFVDIKVGSQILNCENCSRILYFTPAETATV